MGSGSGALIFALGIVAVKCCLKVVFTGYNAVFPPDCDYIVTFTCAGLVCQAALNLGIRHEQGQLVLYVLVLTLSTGLRGGVMKYLCYLLRSLSAPLETRALPTVGHSCGPVTQPCNCTLLCASLEAWLSAHRGHHYSGHTPERWVGP